MADRAGAVNFKGNPITLSGPEIKPGADAPDFTAVDNGLQPVKLQTDGRFVVDDYQPLHFSPPETTEAR